MKGPRTIRAEVPAAAYGRQEALRAAARLIEWAAAAPQGRPQDEYIHELRVRLRRARAVMRAFRRFYPTRADFERRGSPLPRLPRARAPPHAAPHRAGGPLGAREERPGHGPCAAAPRPRSGAAGEGQEAAAPGRQARLPHA